MSAFGRLLAAHGRRLAAKGSELVVKRYAEELNMHVVCGYPKSGTVWLSRLLSTYLGLPLAQNSILPVAMPSVVHAHWRAFRKAHRVAYVYRDARDVMVSMYFHQMLVRDSGDPRARSILQRRHTKLFGPSFDPANVRANLPRFMEFEFVHPYSVREPWADHVRGWLEVERSGVALVSYEELLRDCKRSMTSLLGGLEVSHVNEEILELSIDRWAFRRTSGRQAGVEDRRSFARKGVAGDWRNFFTLDAAQVVDAFAGEVLAELGYVSNSNWVSECK